MEKIEQVKKELTTPIKIVDIGPINFYFDLKVKRDYEKKTLKLLQLVYIDKILAKYHLDPAKLSNMLMKEGNLLSSKTKASLEEQEQYQEITRSLMFSIVV